jgi:phosphatidylinositol alpha-1,6-mannosyltransferase
VLPELIREMPEVSYVIAGSGWYRAELERKAQRLGVATHVVFTGEVPEDEKAAHYQLADAFAMPGSAKRFDRYALRFVFLEAMACGLPVVASEPEDAAEPDAPPLPHINVNPSDPEALKAGLRSALALGRSEVPAGLSFYAYPSFSRRLHGIVREVTARGRIRASRHLPPRRAAPC